MRIFVVTIQGFTGLDILVDIITSKSSDMNYVGKFSIDLSPNIK